MRDIITELGGVQQAAVIEQLRDEMAAAHARVVVGKGQNCCRQSHQYHLQDGVVAQTRVLPPPTPRHVGTDEKRPPKATENTKQDKREELQKVPWVVELHVEEDQSTVAEGVDGA